MTVFQVGCRGLGAKLRQLFGLVALSMLAACGHQSNDSLTTPLTQANRNPLDACCAGIETYPPGLIKFIEPASMLFGRSISKVEWRWGYLYQKVEPVVEETAQPMDVIVVSSKNRLTGHTIPGLFGHAAIYLGTEAQLKKAGVWSAPTVKPYQDAVRAGKIIIEADQSGVHLTELARVLDTDRIVLLRPTVLTVPHKAEALAEAFGRIGMPFDFHFSVDTPECTFCSELVTLVLPELKVPPRVIYGRRLIIPDDLPATAAFGGKRLKLALYLAGTSKGFAKGTVEDLRADLWKQWGPYQTAKTRAPTETVELREFPCSKTSTRGSESFRSSGDCP